MISDIIRSFGKDNMAILPFLNEGNKNGGASQGGLLDNPSIPRVEDLSNLIDEVFFAILHFKYRRPIIPVFHYSNEAVSFRNSSRVMILKRGSRAKSR